MSLVRFYVLDAKDRFKFSVRLAQKAWHLKQKILIRCGRESILERMDRLLWTEDQQSFIPHGRLGEADPVLNPILLSLNEWRDHAIVLNLAEDIIQGNEFDKLFECVDQNNTQLARQHYRQYQQQGHQIEVISI